MTRQGTALIALIMTGSLATAWIMGWYPAAIMQGPRKAETRVIWMFSANRVARATLAYYENALAGASSTIAQTPEAMREARVKSIEALIGNALVHAEIVERGMEEEAARMLAAKMEGYAAQPEFPSAVALVYGLDASGFLEFIARPETEREMLMAKESWNEAGFAIWLETEKKTSRIVRFVK